MANFAYTGRKGGKLVKGSVEALSSSAAADVILGQGITPIEILESGARSGGGQSILKSSMFREKILPYDVMLFSRQMYTLLKAGVPMMRALVGLQESAVNPAMKDVIQDVRTSLDSGRELSASLARHPRIYTTFYLSIVLLV